MTAAANIDTSTLCANPRCTIRFVPYRPHHVYCSTGCKHKDRKTPLRVLRYHGPDTRCPECGVTFKPRRTGQRCCSKACSKRYSVRGSIDVYLDGDVHEALNAEAKRLDRSVSWVARRCVSIVLGKRDLMSADERVPAPPRPRSESAE